MASSSSSSSPLLPAFIPIPPASLWGGFRFGAGPGNSNASVPAHLQIAPEKFASLKERVTERLRDEEGIDYRTLQAHISDCQYYNPPRPCATILKSRLRDSRLVGGQSSQVALEDEYRNSRDRFQTCLGYREMMGAAYEKEYDPTDRTQQLSRRNHLYSTNLVRQGLDECTALATEINDSKFPSELSSVPPPQIPLSSLFPLPVQLSQPSLFLPVESKVPSATPMDEDVTEYQSRFSTPALLAAVPWLQNVLSGPRLPLFSPHLDELYQLNQSNRSGANFQNQ